MKYLDIKIKISPHESIVARKWCIENGIKYAMTGHTIECMLEYDKNIDHIDMNRVPRAYEPMTMGFQFDNEADATAFKLRWA